MLGRQPLLTKLMAIGLGLTLSGLASTAEAGVFDWFKRTEIKWSPEIHGVITEQGKPVTDQEVKRRLYYEGKEQFDTTTTDANGQFHFPQKTRKVRRVMFDVSVAMELYVTNYPTANEDDLVFRVANLNHLNYQALDLILSEMQCELAAPTKNEQLKYLEDLNLADIAPAVLSKCSFTHADKALFSEEELQRLIEEDAKNIEHF
ncbi:DUF6795 domain-containing protein [Arsukibacterium ikkense]|uniref:DUF6795 domain-containing protein n=1 Tax=Arsukibacterium ikkense TaxID=336831 RepID=UPI00069A210D|nr:DUF6795 domain-containing protein [Arsukibacterium ikkense]